MAGGPQTTEGKKKSRRNATKHGMTARALLTDLLGRQRIDEAFEQLAAEWEPRSPTERTLIREMARHEVALDRIQEMEDAVLRRGAESAMEFGLGSQADSALYNEMDTALAGAGTTEAIERISRYRRAHERGYYKSLSAIRDLRDSQAACDENSGGPNTPESPNRKLTRRFESEAQCKAYLLSRFQNGEVPCPHCGACEGRFLPSRKTWQCRNCRQQTSLRAGTVMAGSHVNLMAWFRMIEMILEDPDTAISDLAKATGIRRHRTLRRMREKIENARQAPDASAQLAGLV